MEANREDERTYEVGKREQVGGAFVVDGEEEAPWIYMGHPFVSYGKKIYYSHSEDGQYSRWLEEDFRDDLLICPVELL